MYFILKLLISWVELLKCRCVVINDVALKKVIGICTLIGCTLSSLVFMSTKFYEF